ncbi:Asp-tRNA(Asn)/Glu-tRNA(Gln) amidotransferase subunit GatC [Numidum massiliense]|uniref:Asp-tRNA(Asn)/Glu-tRNA(Gln) amidotransferase subunit GatC n=1 Tax=Numidum massiliense TaxID=1522315 RepID=UPI000AAFB0B7
MSISKEEVRRVAELARLTLSDAECAQFQEQLNEILHFAEKLNEVDTEGVPPTTHVLALKNALREDEVKPSLPRETALANAPDAQDGQFKVPSVFEE